MTNTPTPEEAVERARRAQDQRVETVRALAQARQDLHSEREAADRERAELEAHLKDRLRDFEASDVRAFNAATSAGWSTDELRKIGFTEPDKRRRARRPARRKPASEATQEGLSDAD